MKEAEKIQKIMLNIILSLFHLFKSDGKNLQLLAADSVRLLLPAYFCSPGISAGILTFLLLCALAMYVCLCACMNV